MLADILGEKAFIFLLRACKLCRSVLLPLVQAKRAPMVPYLKMLPVIERFPSRPVTNAIMSYRGCVKRNFRDVRGRRFKACREIYVTLFGDSHRMRVTLGTTTARWTGARWTLSERTTHWFNMTTHINENPRLCPRGITGFDSVSSGGAVHLIDSFDALMALLSSDHILRFP